MSRRDADMRGRDALRSGKTDMGREMRFPPQSLRGRMHVESRGRDDHRHSPRRRSPVRVSRDRIDDGYHTLRSRSHDGHRRLSVERRSGRDATPPRERRGSPRILGRATPPARSPRMTSRGAVQVAAAAAVFPGEFVGRHPAEAFSSRNDDLDRQGPASFHSGSGMREMEGSIGVQGDQSSFSSYGMLVSRSMILEDGSVRTFYTLPPDPSLDTLRPPADDGLGGKFLPSYGDGIPAYGPDGRYAPVDDRRFGEPSRGDLIAAQDRMLTDRKIPGQNQFSAGDGGLRAWPGSLELGHISTVRRERSPSPHRSAIDLRSQRRVSMSPLRDGNPRYGREGAFNSLNRDVYASELDRSARTNDIGRRGLPGDSELSLREKLASPRRRGPIEDPRVNVDRGGIGYAGNSKHDEPMRILEEGRVGPQRGAPSVFHRDISDNYPREMISPREDGAGFSRSSRMSGYRDGPTYEQDRGATVKQFRSPPQEASWNPRDEINSQRRGSVYRAGMEVCVSPMRVTHLSPRRQRSLSPSNLRQGPLDFYDSEKRAWKRKYGEREQEFHEVGRMHRFDEPDFKRRGREGDLYPGDGLFSRRVPGWERPDGYIERRAEREGGDFTKGDFGRRPWEEKGGSPRLPRRFPPHLDDDRRGMAFNDRDAYLHSHDKPHGFHRESVSIADKNNFWRDNDMQREFVREIEPQTVLDLPEDSPEFKQQVHRAYMKYAKSVNENPGQRKRYEEQGKAGTLLCLACSRFSKPFVDTHSLVMHTHMSQKRGLRAEHLGLCKAICTIMSWNSDIDPTNGKSYQQVTAEEAKANKDDLILWPPAVVIHNAAAGNTSDGQQEGVSNSAVKELLKDLGLTHEKIKIVDGRQGALIVKYLATFSCLHEAETLHQHFATCGHGREDWLRVQPTEKDNINAKESRVLYGYLALANDLDKVDMEFRRRGLVRSRKEIETILDDSLTSKKP